MDDSLIDLFAAPPSSPPPNGVPNEPAPIIPFRALRPTPRLAYDAPSAEDLLELLPEDLAFADVERSPTLVTRVGDVMRAGDALRHALSIAEFAVEELERVGDVRTAPALRRQIGALRKGDSLDA